MKPDSKLAQSIENGDFIITAEYLPRITADKQSVDSVLKTLGNGLTAVNVSDNPYGVALSSLAASAGMATNGIEPIFQMVTRDRNRIALQSDLLGAAYLGIKNVLCLSGYHQTLTASSGSANVYDIDSIQLLAAVTGMNEQRVLINGAKIGGEFSMIAGAVANPFLEPLELNIIRLAKKVKAGAQFIQTQPVFNIEKFRLWIEAANQEGITEKTAIIPGILPLNSFEEAERLREFYTDHIIPNEIIDRLRSAGDDTIQKNTGLAICSEIIGTIKDIQGVCGIHILSGGKEDRVPELLDMSGL
ncbi:MAG: methylenetetrahydrofolate reductase [Candidatus Latescibacteria bacterium]|nr:methylenetetrahydrofolate reductase [Candidatus Latescibacterota bacterium]